MTSRNIEHLIQRQLSHWSHFKSLLRSAERPEEVKPRPTITLSRELGSGGRLVAEALARRLDLQVHGVSLIDHIARDKKLERRMVDELDEKVRSDIDMWVDGMLNRRMFSQDEYHVSLVRAVRTLAAHGGVVIIGRGANLILADTASLRIRVVASLDRRIRNLMKYEKLDEKMARERIEETDTARRRFIEKLFEVDVNDPCHYDLTFNSDRLPIPRMVEIAMTALETLGVFDA